MPDPAAPATMTDEEFFAARRETMGEKYPGDEAMRRQDAEDTAATQTWTERQQAENAPADPAPATPATAAAAPAADWEARAWLRETFKDDPRFGELSEADLSRLEAMANERHDALGTDLATWATGLGDDYGGLLHDQIDTIRAEHPELATVPDDELGTAIANLPSAELAAAVHPLVGTLREADGDILDGTQVLVGTAIDGMHDIVEARAAMPGGHSLEIDGLIETVEAKPAELSEELGFVRADHEVAWDKAEARLDAIEHGADPRSLHDPDTWQADPNAAATAASEA